MQDLLDRLLNPLMPDQGYVYFPVAKMLMILGVCSSILLMLYFLHKAVKAVRQSGINKAEIKIRVMSVIIVWNLFSLLAAWSGVTGSQSQFYLLPFVFLPVIGIIILSRNKAVVRMLDVMPDAVLINAQLFRLFFEPVAFLLFIEDHFPLQATLEGNNPEMMVSVSAPVLIAMFFNDDIKRYRIAILWNFIGLASLFYFTWLLFKIPPDPGIYSTTEPPALVLSTNPFILYLSFYVPAAFGLHFLSIKQLIRDRRNPIKYDISYLEPEMEETKDSE